jgi:hypothetical protein
MPGMTHDALRDRYRDHMRTFLRKPTLPDWRTVTEPAVVLGLHLPQDVSVEDAAKAVFAKIDEIPNSSGKRALFDVLFAGHEESFAWLLYAARRVGLVLIPDLPKDLPR